jgi:DNA-binding beta-propeller fold protein YncE
MRHVSALALATCLSFSTLVSGCSLKSSPVAAPPVGGAQSSVVHAGSPVRDTYVLPKLYAVMATVGVYVYKQAGTNQQPTKTLTSGLHQPEGVTVNPANGDLYVTNYQGSSISVFKRGANKPYKTLNDPSAIPDNAVVDTSGTIYVCNYELEQNGTLGPPGNVAVYAAGATSPTSTLSGPSGDWILQCALDDNHNLYVGYTDNASTSNVWEFPGASGPGSSLGLKIGFPGEMEFNSKGNLVVADERNSKALTFKLPGTKPIGSIATPSGGVTVGMTLNAKSTKLFLSDFVTQQIYEYSYPKGTLLDTITPPGGNNLIDVAADPAAPL